MKIKIYIDSNAWDILYDQKVDLDEELNEFDFCITEEVKIEMDKISTENPRKRNIKEYFYKYINSDLITICDVRYFAIGDLKTPPKIRPYTKGFGSVNDASEGNKFASCADSDEREMIDSQMRKKPKKPKKKKTGLEKEQTDVFLAAESKKILC